MIGPFDRHRLVTLDEIKAAAERVRDVALRTPVIDVSVERHVDRRGRPSASAKVGSLCDPTSPVLVRRSAFADRPADRRRAMREGWSGPPDNVFALKCEQLQPMGAFKIRGAYNMLAQLADAGVTRVITYSSGNHGQAVALAAQRLGIAAVIVMPETASRVKVDGVRRFGGEVIFAGTTSLDRKTRAEAEAAARGLAIVPPFDHPWIIAGAGTCGLEILDQRPELTAVYVPLGGGGLISGVAAAIKALRPDVRVIGVEPAGAAKMVASRAAGHPVTLDRTWSIADGLVALRPGDLTFAHVQAFVDDIVTVTDDAIASAVGWLFREATLTAEPSGAASVAAVLQAGASVAPGTIAVVSGGNVAPEDLARYLQA